MELFPRITAHAKPICMSFMVGPSLRWNRAFFDAERRRSTAGAAKRRSKKSLFYWGVRRIDVIQASRSRAAGLNLSPVFFRGDEVGHACRFSIKTSGRKRYQF